MEEMKIHGTYPFDSRSGRWATVRQLTAKEAMLLLKESAGQERIDAAPDVLPPGQYPKFYPWINKGYVLLGVEAPALSGMAAALLEGQSGELGLKGLKVGQQAVYLHDGYFSLIEVR